MSGRPPRCGQVRGDLGFLLVPDHDPERAAELREHLAACTACRLDFAEARRNFDTLRRAPAPEPGPGFSREIMERLPRKVPRRRRRARLALIPLLALAALAPGFGTVAASRVAALDGPGLVGISDGAADLAAATARAAASAVAALVGDAPSAGLETPGVPLGAGPVALAVAALALAGLLSVAAALAFVVARRARRVTD